MTEPFDLVILGCGYTGRVVAARARAAGLNVCGTVRSEARAAALEADRLAGGGLVGGLVVVRAEKLDAAVVTPLVGPKTRVIVAFPPDGETEHAILPAIRQATHVTFVSSTGVYGDVAGRIDDETAIPAPSSAVSASSARYLAAESLFREIGGTTLRCPGIYGPDRGLHVRVVSGQHKIPGDGSRATSRIHVADLAAFVLAAPKARGETFVVGDLAPGPHGETVRWIAETYGVPMPPHVAIESVHESLRGDRRIDPARALRVLGVELAFPTYAIGMSPANTGIAIRASSCPS